MPLAVGALVCLSWFGVEHPMLLMGVNRLLPVGLFSGGDATYPDFAGGDSIQVFYLFWKLREALRSGSDLFADTFNFVAVGERFHDVSVGVQYWFAVVLSFVVEDVSAYTIGVIVIPSLLLLAATYWLVMEATPRPWLGMIAGCCATFLPSRLTQASGGHGGAAVLFLMPLYWAAVLRRQRDAASRWPSLVAACALFLCIISDEHLGFYLLIASGIIFPIWCVQALVRAPSLRTLVSFVGYWRALLVALAATVAYGLVLNHVVLGANESAATYKRSFAEIERYSYALPALLWGPTNAGGVVLISLCFGACLSLAVRPRFFLSLARSRWLPFAVALPVLCVLTLGIGSHWSQRSGVYEFFYAHLPFFSYQRVPTKMFGQVAIFALVLLAALTHFIAQTTQRGAFLAMVTGAVLLAQLANHWRCLHTELGGMHFVDMRAGPSGFYEQVRSTVGESDIILPLPLTDRMDAYATWAQFLAWRTHRRMASGYNGSAPPYFLRQLPFLSSYNAAAPSRAAANAVRALGYTHVLVDGGRVAERYGSTELAAKLESVSHLHKLNCADHLCLFSIDRASLDDPALPSRGWSGATSKGGVAGQWMLQEPTRARPEFEVLSQVDVGAGQVEVLFDPVLPIALWVVPSDGAEIEYPEASWQRVSGTQRRVVAPVKGPFYLGCKAVFEPRKYEVPTDYAKYCHFVYVVRPVERMDER